MDDKQLNEMVRSLIEEYGSIKHALEATIREIIRLQETQDLYQLSIWRDIKIKLKEYLKNEFVRQR